MMQLSNTEEQLMEHLWKLKKAFMKDLLEAYSEPKPAPTTIATLLKRMTDKKFVSLTLEEMDEIINGNITITDSRLRDGVYGVVLDTITTLMDKNGITPWEEDENG